MAKNIRLTAKNGMIKEVPFGAQVKLDRHFADAKIEVIDSATGVQISPVKTHVEEKDLVLSLTVEGQPEEARLEGAAEGTGTLGTSSAEDATDPASAFTASSASSNSESEVSVPQTSSSTPTAPAEQSKEISASTLALGVLGLGALGGIAVAAGSGGSGNGNVAGGPDRSDTTSPAAPTHLDLASADDTGASSSDSLTSQTSGLTITGQAEPDARVELFAGNISLGTSTADGSGKFSLDVTLPAGTHSITAIATDASGNVGTASSALSITVDITAPAITTQAVNSASKTITLTYDGPLDAANPPAPGDFAVTTGGVNNPVSTVAIDGSILTLTLTRGFAPGAVTIAYTASEGDAANAIQDLAGNDALSFSSGIVADGYIRGASVYIDTNDNGLIDGEIDYYVGDTNADGNFIIDGNAPSGVIMAAGGVNIDTGAPNTILLKAPAASTTINPLTTLVQAVLDANPGLEKAEASKSVAAALGLDPATDLTRYDPISEGDIAGQKAAAQVATMAALAESNAGAASATFANIASLITHASTANAQVNLADPATVSAVLQNTGVNAKTMETIVDTNTAIAVAEDFDAISLAQAQALTAMSVTVIEDGAVSVKIPALMGDGDLSYTIDAAEYGVVTAGSGGVFTYEPNPNYNGLDGFTVAVSDGQGGTTLQVVNVTVSPVDDAATGKLSVAGTAEEGGSLTANLANVVDVDGTTTTAYKWQESIAGTWTDIAGASSATLNIPADQSYVGKSVRAVATTTDALGGTTTFIGNAQTIANIDDEADGSLSTLGAAEEGGSLTAKLANVIDADGTTTTAYKWQENIAGTWTDIAGASSTTLSIPADQSYVGKNVRAVATTTDALGGTTTFIGDAHTIANIDDGATGSLSVTGTMTEGGTARANLSAVDVDGDIVSTSYQWQISANGTTGWTDISGATSATYDIASDDSESGHHLRVVATTTDALGGNTIFISDATAAIADVTNVAGAYLEDTTWTTGSVINLTGDVQIDAGVTLTVEPGVTINANGYEFLVGGSLIMDGNADNQIHLNNARVTFGNEHQTPGYLKLDHVQMTEGSMLPATGYAAYGAFDLTHSTFNGVDGFYIWYPTSSSTISQNIFDQSAGLSTGISDSTALTISNNVFASQTTDYAIENWANYNDQLFVTGNSFLSTDKVALALPEGYDSASMIAENNYFGTTDEATINAMILDRNDSLKRNEVIDVSPWLNAPSPDTPGYALDYVPVPLVDPENGPTILLADTTWTTGSVINLTGDVQIDAGVTLTVEPGVTINANGYEFLVGGSLIMDGNADSQIHLNNARVIFGNEHQTPGYLKLDHVQMTEGSMLPATGYAAYGAFDLTHSTFNGVDGFYIWYPTSSSTISQNIFDQSAGLSTGISDSTALTISNNVFASQTTDYAIENWANYNDQLFVTGNSFLSTDKVALALPEGYDSASMIAENNYFGTTDEATINAMILDRNDSLKRNEVIDVFPWLNAPSPDTPAFEPASYLMAASAGSSLPLVTIADGQSYMTDPDIQDEFLNDLTQSLSATIVGFDAGDILRFDNLSEHNELRFEQEVMADGIATLFAGSTSATLSDLVNNNFDDGASYEATYSANAISYVM